MIFLNDSNLVVDSPDDDKAVQIKDALLAGTPAAQLLSSDSTDIPLLSVISIKTDKNDDEIEIQYKPGKEVATRIELRFPDAVCNPYLAFAVMLSAGLDGLDKEMELRPQSTEDLYVMSDAERKAQGIGALPHDLYQAVRSAEDSSYLSDTLGAGVLAKLSRALSNGFF